MLRKFSSQVHWAMAALFLPTLGFAQSIHPLSVDMGSGTGKVEFKAIGHPSSLKIIGTGNVPQGKLTLTGNQVNGQVVFDLETLDTGITLRTHHMKEKYLETGKYPKATLTFTKLDLPREITQEQFSSDQVPFTGVLSLHGVEKPVSGVAKIEKKGNQLSTDARFTLKISDYQIAVPTFAGITIADEVQVTVLDSAPLVGESKKSVAQ